MQRNISIQLIRIIAMFMIISDHILSHLNFPLRAVIVQLTNSGVLIFLFLSAFLYGNKQVKDWKAWYIKRFFRICIPMWIFMLFDFVIEAIAWHIFDVKYVFIYLFNLQGILGTNIGGMNLWFLTLLMICYLITPLLQWIRSKNPGVKVAVITFAFAIVIQIILAYVTDIGMVFGHTLSWCVLAVGVYVIGYFAGNHICGQKISMKRILLLSVAAILASLCVIFCRKYFDGKIIYDRIIIYYGMLVLDWWLVTVLYKIGTYIKNNKMLRVIKHLDTISYEFYIVHGLVIMLVLFYLVRHGGAILYIAGSLGLSYVAAWGLHAICAVVYRIRARRELIRDLSNRLLSEDILKQ